VAERCSFSDLEKGDHRRLWALVGSLDAARTLPLKIQMKGCQAKAIDKYQAFIATRKCWRH